MMITKRRLNLLPYKKLSLTQFESKSNEVSVIKCTNRVYCRVFPYETQAMPEKSTNFALTFWFSTFGGIAEVISG